MEMEFKRNRARYQFLKWGMQAFNTFKVVPPGIGIVHQVNLEYLAKGVLEKDGVYYPDTLVGTDSHTTMINGLGVVGWGVGGIEAEAGMLGQPVYFLTPDVVGVHLTGALRRGRDRDRPGAARHRDAAQGEGRRQVRRVLRRGRGVALRDRSRDDRQHGARNTARRWASSPSTRRPAPTCARPAAAKSRSTCVPHYFKAQGLFGIPSAGEIDYSQVLELDLATIEPSVAGPKRPQDRIELPSAQRPVPRLFIGRRPENGYGKTARRIATCEARASKRIEAPAVPHPVSGGGRPGDRAGRPRNGIGARQEHERRPRSR